tara:strand:+ start:897 stop:1463 length:567 start_codon:yes stop_codon:yes gene_type:complete
MFESIRGAIALKTKPPVPDEECITILEDKYSSGEEWKTVTGQSETKGGVMTPPENPTFNADITLNYYGKKIKLEMGVSYVAHKQYAEDVTTGFTIGSLGLEVGELNDDEWEEVYEVLRDHVDEECHPDVPSHAQETIDKAEAPFREAQFKRMIAFQQGLCPSCGGGLEYEDAFNGHVCVECETEYFDA